MTKYLIMTEKPSARKKFEEALGGRSGHFDDFDYELVNLRGHVMTLAEPENQVSADQSEKMKSWDLENLPWNLNDFSWKRTYIVSKNPKTGKKESTKPLIDNLKEKSREGFDGIIIATDTDPSGEGDLLAWEALNAIDWTGQVYRANFTDESSKSLKKALSNLDLIVDQFKNSAYQKGLARNKWDFASIQLTRAATSLTKEQGYPGILSKQGRLKSAMVLRVYQQLEAIKNYKKIPFYETRYKDENGNIYSRQAPKDPDDIDYRFPSEKALAENEHLPEEGVPIISSEEIKETTPPKLIDLSALSAKLEKEGFSTKEVLATYQNMYEAQVVSYPRTEDKNITPEQFNDLLPLVDDIANIVGLDKSLLTNREPRKSHVIEKGAHGANRPGSKVPDSLEDLLQYGPSAAKIYEILAKNYLAMFAGNYRYKQLKANLVDQPDFQTTINTPLDQGWKKIYNNATGATEEETPSQIGQKATRFVYEGQNKKPTTPTRDWLNAFLKKYDIGTGATQSSTYSDISSGKHAYLTSKKGKLGLTNEGLAAAYIIQGTYIGDPRLTKRVFDIFKQVGQFKMSPDEALNSINVTVDHDIPVMENNAKSLATVLGDPEPIKEKSTGLWNGKEVQFNKSFSGHDFTDEEIQQLLDGETITFQAISKKGTMYTAKGKLAEKTYKGNKFVGFNMITDKKKGRKR